MSIHCGLCGGPDWWIMNKEDHTDNTDFINLTFTDEFSYKRPKRLCSEYPVHRKCLLLALGKFASKHLREYSIMKWKGFELPNDFEFLVRKHD